MSRTTEHHWTAREAEALASLPEVELRRRLCVASRRWALSGVLSVTTWLLLVAGCCVLLTLGTTIGATMAMTTLVVSAVMGARLRQRPPAEPAAEAHATAVEVAWEALPEVAAWADDIAKVLGLRTRPTLWLSCEFNAYVDRASRGWSLRPVRPRLVLGLPLLAALSVIELRGLLGHELAHLREEATSVTRRQRRLVSSVQAYARRARNGDLFAQARMALAGKGMLVEVILLDAALARQAELRADAAATRVCEAGTLGASLLRVGMASKLWKIEGAEAVLRPATTLAAPPASAVLVAMAAVRDAWPGPLGRAALRLALFDVASLMDRHPPLPARLAALGLTPAMAAGAIGPDLVRMGLCPPWGSLQVDLEPPVWHAQGSAADALAPASWQAAIDSVDGAVAAETARAWEREQRQARERAAIIAALTRGVIASDTLAPRLRPDLADFLIDDGDLSAAERVLARAAAEPAPDAETATRVRYLQARVSLARGDGCGAEAMEALLGEPGVRTEEACEALERHHARRGDARAAAAIAARREAYIEAEAERVSLADAAFDPHALDAGDLAALRAALAARPEVNRAYLARKVLPPHLPALHVLVVVLRVRAWLRGPAWRAAWHKDLESSLPLPAGGWIILHDVPSVAVPAIVRLTKVPGAEMVRASFWRRLLRTRPRSRGAARHDDPI